MALSLVNYEPWFNGGYRRIYGYEVFDGSPRPSEQTFTGFEVSDASSLSLGDTVDADSTSASGICVGIWIDDGTYGTDSIAVTKLTGVDFADGDACNTAAFTIDSDPVQRFAPDDDIESTWLLEAQDSYRDDIAVVPGEGPVRGTWQRGAANYAVRDEVGGAKGVLHKGSATGWDDTLITMGVYVYFDLGGGTTNEPLPEEGDVIYGNTSTAVGTVHRVIHMAGATSANDAIGYLVLTSVTGTFSDNEEIRDDATKTIHLMDADGASAAFALSDGGVYQFVNHNFFGGSGTYRTYGVNGVDSAFEIDENDIVSPIFLPTFAQLNAGASEYTGSSPPDTLTPFLIEEHRNHLFMAFPGGSMVQSVVGMPLHFNGFLGAAEFGMGDEITGLNSVVGGVLVVTSERETKGLFGKTIDDWELKLVGEKTGGKLYTSQKMDTVYGLDDLGITSISRTDAFGSFMGATVSQLVQPLVNLYKDRATSASIVRSANQYRLYFDDGTGLVMYIPTAGQEPSNRAATRTKVEFSQLSYPITIQQMYDTEDGSGIERHYFTSDDGFVYENGVGTNFNGADIRSTVRLVYNQLKTPSMRKKYRRAILEMESQKPLTLKIIYDLTYGGSETKAGNQDFVINAGGGLWDVDNWDEFYWDGQTVSTASVGLGGSGTNISMLIFNESATARPFIMQGVTLHYDLRRLQR
jgi:hypothetical protein